MNQSVAALSENVQTESVEENSPHQNIYQVNVLVKDNAKRRAVPQLSKVIYYVVHARKDKHCCSSTEAYHNRRFENW